ncbi:RrF2 family transcriptional regulator [Muriicola sp. Z0-33]|uniref:RrF2 family transcriptional regulator n=1 Tax=Muriicola sp. Z0-33 TaxID=2816957 RepID=UPI00223890BF|nr:Rrf2 family transcriptional regulator [Muriicola sp. Z0-33]MCW5517171.1 Rrf2 family transcriptional regulator [Muriicola sp. Z0-33]
MFSNSSKYAIKAVLYLALHASEDNKLMVKDICKPINVPKAYLSKLLQDLSRHRIVSSTRGPKGGFYLSELNKDLFVMDIVGVIDGKNKLESCLLSLKDCSKDKPCPLHHAVSSSRSKMIKSLESTSIRELSENLGDKKAFLPL